MNGMWWRPINPPMRDWRGRRVWLIGASSGIGEATARALHAAGAQVVVSARNALALDAWVAQHPGSTALPLDVTDAAAVADAARGLLNGGGIDLVIYLASHLGHSMQEAVKPLVKARGLPAATAQREERDDERERARRAAREQPPAGEDRVAERRG